MITTRVCRIIHLRSRRCFSTINVLRSGHNRWSKIKHDKAKEDASVTRQRSAVAQELSQASKEYGPDPQMNPRLADIVTKAKRIGFPKASIENAIARGQGVSPSGAALESLTIEAMVPPSVATIIECQTDSKLRTLSDIRLAIKEMGGTVTPTNHMFERKGRITLEKPQEIEETEIFDKAVEAGAIDMEIQEDNTVIVSTESNQTTAVADALVQTTGLKVKSSDIVWDPKEDMMVDSLSVESHQGLEAFLDRIHEDPCVQDVYTNYRPSTV